MKGRILVVDDDNALSEMLGIVLRSEGFTPVFAITGEMARATFREAKPDVVLLDLMLPGKDGIDVCREIRAESDVPIVMLTARTDTVDVVRGLEAGADDYVVKPFKPKELVARIRARLRRVEDAGAPQTLRIGDLAIDVPGHTVRRTTPAERHAADSSSERDDASAGHAGAGDAGAGVDTGTATETEAGAALGLGEDTGAETAAGAAPDTDAVRRTPSSSADTIALTPLEFDLLVCLARKPWQVFTREQLLEQVWGYQHAADTRLVNVHVQRLRSKIEKDPENPGIVVTVRGVGYRAGSG